MGRFGLASVSASGLRTVLFATSSSTGRRSAGSKSWATHRARPCVLLPVNAYFQAYNTGGDPR